jgi:MFS family permease
LSFYLVFPVTNAFGTNNLQSLMPTVLYILQSVLLPTYSKLSDMLGRVECYTISLAFYIIAEIVMATAQNYYTIVVRI